MRRDKEQRHPQEAGIAVVANDVTVTIILSNVLMFSPVVIGLVETHAFLLSLQTVTWGTALAASQSNRISPCVNIPKSRRKRCGAVPRGRQLWLRFQWAPPALFDSPCPRGFKGPLCGAVIAAGPE